MWRNIPWYCTSNSSAGKNAASVRTIRPQRLLITTCMQRLLLVFGALNVSLHFIIKQTEQNNTRALKSTSTFLYMRHVFKYLELRSRLIKNLQCIRLTDEWQDMSRNNAFIPYVSSDVLNTFTSWSDLFNRLCCIIFGGGKIIRGVTFKKIISG